jgi:hypothetical protein
MRDCASDHVRGGVPGYASSGYKTPKIAIIGMADKILFMFY